LFSGNSKARKTLSAIFADPVRADIARSEVEVLLRACGALLRGGKGSRVRVLLGGMAAVFHRPHPSPCLVKAAVRDLRTFLDNAGVRP